MTKGVFSCREVLSIKLHTCSMRIGDCEHSFLTMFSFTEANEQTSHLMVSDQYRPWTPATPEESQVRCRPFKKEYALFLNV
uniref:SFRICE_011652 n=1 Tax=Spodoptera frugiperda TaxID=7108 RepID=A0A2H1VHR4_SPOFR